MLSVKVQGGIKQAFCRVQSSSCLLPCLLSKHPGWGSLDFPPLLFLPVPVHPLAAGTQPTQQRGQGQEEQLSAKMSERK